MEKYKSKNTWAIVTGGSDGIGLAIANELASLGATVVIASRDVSKCEEAARAANNSISKTPGCSGKVVVGPSCSIRDEEQVEQLVRYISFPGNLQLLAQMKSREENFINIYFYYFAFIYNLFSWIGCAYHRKILIS